MESSGRARRNCNCWMNAEVQGSYSQKRPEGVRQRPDLCEAGAVPGAHSELVQHPIHRDSVATRRCPLSAGAETCELQLPWARGAGTPPELQLPWARGAGGAAILGGAAGRPWPRGGRRWRCGPWRPRCAACSPPWRQVSGGAATRGCGAGPGGRLPQHPVAERGLQGTPVPLPASPKPHPAACCAGGWIESFGFSFLCVLDAKWKTITGQIKRAVEAYEPCVKENCSCHQR